jgi:subtilisin-like proprotein convertase family protein
MQRVAWTLEVRDETRLDIGKIRAFGLELTFTVEPRSAPSPRRNGRRAAGAPWKRAVAAG